MVCREHSCGQTVGGWVSEKAHIKEVAPDCYVCDWDGGASDILMLYNGKRGAAVGLHLRKETSGEDKRSKHPALPLKQPPPKLHHWVKPRPFCTPRFAPANTSAASNQDFHCEPQPIISFKSSLPLFIGRDIHVGGCSPHRVGDKAERTANLPAGELLPVLSFAGDPEPG